MSQLIPALPGLVAIGLGTGLLALFGRDPKANEHDLSDYHEADEVTPRTERLHQLDRAAFAAFTSLVVRDASVPLNDEDDDILPPAPPGTNAGGSPIHAALVAEQVIAEQLRKWGATPAERAHRILRELGDKAQMEATR